jgi:hypothetical protein
MSVYQVNKICREILHNLNFRSATQNDPIKSISFFKKEYSKCAQKNPTFVKSDFV